MSEPELRLCLDDEDLAAALRFDAKRGLTSSPKYLPMRLHYDGRGAALFAELTRRPEYYPARCERALLTDHAADIAAAVTDGEATTDRISVIELGAGLAEKIRVVLSALSRGGRLEAFWPFDVDASTVKEVLTGLAAEFPDIRLGGIVGDFTLHLAHLPDDHRTRLIVFLGGTFGNFTGMERGQLLRDLREALRPGDRFMVGADLVKDPATILAAYNDAAGVTAEFNRNVLRVLNHRLDADFRLDRFEHLTLWDPVTATVDLRLRALEPMTVDLAAIGLGIGFTTGEEIHTGISTKFHPAELEGELAAAGFRPERRWSDDRGCFGLFLARVA